jgi:hypothetical protein
MTSAATIAQMRSLGEWPGRDIIGAPQAPVAQWIEQRFSKPLVAGSIPAGRAFMIAIDFSGVPW